MESALDLGLERRLDLHDVVRAMKTRIVWCEQVLSIWNSDTVLIAALTIRHKANDGALVSKQGLGKGSRFACRAFRSIVGYYS